MNKDYLNLNQSNNDKFFEIHDAEYLNYNQIYSNYNPKDINDNLSASDSFVFTNNNNENDNNIESEIEADLKKYAKLSRYNQQKNSNLAKDYFKSNKLENYINSLKNLGYPDIGKIYLSQEKSEQEKTFNFFEFIISQNKKFSTYKEFEKYKKKYGKLEEKMQMLKKELSDEIKLNSNMQKKIDIKINKLKEFYDNQLSLSSKENSNLKNEINKLTNEKNILSNQLYHTNNTINKFESMKSTIINAFKAMDYVQSNDMVKMLSRVKVAEELTEILKGEYNESLKEYLLEITILKKFVNDINNELCMLIENPSNIEMDNNDNSFMEYIRQIKEVFKNNIDKIKQNLKGKNTIDSNSQVYGKFYDSLNETKNVDKCKINPKE